MYLNRAILVGNLTRDPELKTLPSGTKVASFGLATNRVWRDASGNRQESTDFHNIVVFGRQAETSAQFLRKGSQVLIEGRIQTRSWDDQATGKKMYRTEIVADRVQFGSRPGNYQNQAGSQEINTPKVEEASVDTINYPEEEINPDDIPF